MAEPAGDRYAIVVARFYEELAERLGHRLHHQALALDEELIHSERVEDRRRERQGGAAAAADPAADPATEERGVD